MAKKKKTSPASKNKSKPQKTKQVKFPRKCGGIS